MFLKVYKFDKCQIVDLTIFELACLVEQGTFVWI